ncbi:hypothetical protein [Streptomyces mutabilis]|uniref:Uncharacterized protein n=1 Tax=Streptomyces mutabilis TaxID=67332 RepID=A0A086MQG9_9ACTN|nr:hypothetical protein [Streptomyces mutabilis]KFG71137.1 hypothetical protein FM21_36330 [Streptomyces mutabilis]
MRRTAVVRPWSARRSVPCSGSAEALGPAGLQRLVAAVALYNEDAVLAVRPAEEARRWQAGEDRPAGAGR